MYLGDTVSDVITSYEGADKIGTYVSNAITSPIDFRHIKANLDSKHFNENTVIMTEVMASNDLITWSERYDLSDGANCDLLSTYKYFKYIITVVAYDSRDNSRIQSLSFDVSQQNSSDKP